MADTRKIILTLLLILIITTPISANPYGLYGRGNCTYFTVECLEKFWPITPNIPRNWNACDWVQLIGQERDGYRIIQVEHPRPGDVFVLPSNPYQYRGHCGFITTVGRTYDLDSNQEPEEYYRVLESSMYPDDSFPYRLGVCKYRVWYYWESDFKDAAFIRLERKEDG